MNCSSELFQPGSLSACASSCTIFGGVDVSSSRCKRRTLEAAAAVFARVGFRTARMDDIAEQAGLSKGALYLYDKSKDAIIAALLKYFFAQEFKRVQGFVESDREVPVAEQLMILTRQLAQAMQWMSRLVPIAFEFYAIAGHDKEVRQFLKEYVKGYRTLLARLIQRGIKRSEFREVSTEATAITLAALYEGLALLCFVDYQAIRWAEQAETSLRLLLQGLQQPSSS